MTKAKTCPLCEKNVLVPQPDKDAPPYAKFVVMLPTCPGCGEQFIGRKEAKELDDARPDIKCRACGVVLPYSTRRRQAQLIRAADRPSNVVDAEVQRDGLCHAPQVKSRSVMRISCFGLFLQWCMDNEVPDNLVFDPETKLINAATVDQWLATNPLPEES
jgi:DNA-directed RNA polymerase subunit RPC12/RpoP